MAYLQEFKSQIETGNVTKFLLLWEEYCASDTVDAAEFYSALKMISESDLAESAGKYVEAGLPLWSYVTDPELSKNILRAILDLQTTNSELLADTVLKFLRDRYGEEKFFSIKIRIIGLRDRKNFRGALRNYELLSHMDAGKFVYHTGGWGTGEIIEISLVREQLFIEFENVIGRKDLSFDNAFKTLIPLSKDHFLARRFSDPDKLEAEAKENPVQTMREFLRDLGPKTAAEIKEELLDLVIPEEEWSKWWQNTRAKLKKDTMVIAPPNVREPFRLRSSALSHDDRLSQALEAEGNFEEAMLACYNFVRDLPDVLKNQELRDKLIEKFSKLLEGGTLTTSEELQASIFLEHLCHHKLAKQSVKELITKVEDPLATIEEIPIIAFKKRVLVSIKKHRTDWEKLFLQLIGTVAQGALKDYLLKELSTKDSQAALESTILDLVARPTDSPETFVWYFQKIAANKDVPFSNKEGQCRFFEAFLTLYSALEGDGTQRELLKKMYNLLSGKRFAIVRSILEDTSIEFVKEFLLLASKCHSLSSHDMKILRSLAQVVHPSLGPKKKDHASDNIVWTTDDGYQRTHERIRVIGEEEMVDNAKEIEAARALGDLRENAEYKASLERRSRLQAELRALSNDLNKARVITPEDVASQEVGIGSVVSLQKNDEGEESYTLLGPWDAKPEENVLSFQSKFAQAMFGLKAGESFAFNDNTYTVKDIASYLDARNATAPDA